MGKASLAVEPVSTFWRWEMFHGLSGIRTADLPAPSYYTNWAVLAFSILLSITDHHQVLLLLVEHMTSMKSFQALRSPAIPLTSFHDLPAFLISSSVVLATFSSAYLFFYTPEDSSLMQFSPLLVLLYLMCVQSSSIFFFLSEFLLASVW
jgi:hypothetical protein